MADVWDVCTQPMVNVESMYRPEPLGGSLCPQSMVCKHWACLFPSCRDRLFSILESFPFFCF